MRKVTVLFLFLNFVSKIERY